MKFFHKKNKEIKEIAQRFLFLDFHARVPINTFLCHKKRDFLQALEQRSQVVEVLLLGRRRDKYIVYVCVAEVLSSQDVIDKTLEGLCGIAEAESHKRKLEESEWRRNGRFRDVFFGDRYLVKCSH